MTMYRGEAANHGILDVYHLLQALEMIHHRVKSKNQALEEYEAELRQRTNPAVLLSRQACLDAHDFNGLNQHSAVLKRRAIDATSL
jgi:2-polyprenyl-6-methoxyphenol hydroxylase-like FAD-dependent oxidoreductase